jgi:DNA-binding NtrC family response regulator
MTQIDQHRIVILEKKQARRDYIRSIVSGLGYLPFIFEKETNCLDNLISLKPDLVISGPLSNNRMCRFVHTVKYMDGSLPVLIVTGDLSIKEFAASNGFSDIKILKKNFETTEIDFAIKSLIRDRDIGGGNGDQESRLIIGNSPEIVKIKKRIAKLYNLNEPILIQGESGTGKELIARSIHHQSDRCNGPFTKIQLAEMSPGLLDDILFSVGQDGFPSPNKLPSGPDKLADGGTLFLDDVAVLPAADQSRLLTVFEDGGYMSVAENQNIKRLHDMTIIFSSNRVVDQLVKKGKFRKDLFYRMSVISIKIPPLRERVGDIPLLTDFFADKFCLEYGAGHIELCKKIKDSFCRYPWPGNVRELISIVQRAVLYGKKDHVIQNLTSQWARSTVPLNSSNEIYAMAGLSKLKSYLKERNNPTLKSVRNVFLPRTEKAVIKKALEKTNWNRKKAAKMLEISYKSVLNKIKEYQLA